MSRAKPPSAEPSRDLWDAARSYQRIALRDIEIVMKVGVAEIERKQLDGQRIVVNVELFSHKERHVGGDLASVLNYHPIHDFVTREWPTRAHTDLLETLAEELVEVCLRDPRVEACRVSLQKPDIYDDTGAAMVEFYRVRAPR